MAARVCGSCGIRFPAGAGPCEACGEQAIWDANAAPDEDWAARVESYLLSLPSLEERKLHAWRLRRLTQMGFEGAFLDVLSGTPSVRLHEVEALLLRGCSHDDAARILL